MGYCEFLAGLFNDGQVAAPRFAPLAEDELLAGDRILAECEALQRLELPEPAPAFVRAAARWAAVRLFRACQAVIYRDEGTEKLTAFGPGYPTAATPEVHYSVDLAFRYLPDVTRFAASAAQQDPLLEYLFRWAVDWPLSSVGMKLPEAHPPLAIEGFAGHSGVMRLYVDRIFARGDKSRLTDPRVRQAVRETLGYFPELAPGLASALTEFEHQEAIP